MFKSYPNSGGKWLSYCMQHLTGVRVCGYYPAAKVVRDTFTKRPYYSIVWGHGSAVQGGDALIVQVRNYKECTIKHLVKGNAPVTLAGIDAEIAHDKYPVNYITKLQVYDEVKIPKILIYYEDLIANTEKEIERLCEFFRNLEIKENGITFLEHIESHKAFSLDFNGGQTRGDPEKNFFHSQKISPQQRLAVDDFVLKNYPYLTQKYLKRYLENDQGDST